MDEKTEPANDAIDTEQISDSSQVTDAPVVPDSTGDEERLRYVAILPAQVEFANVSLDDLENDYKKKGFYAALHCTGDKLTKLEILLGAENDETQKKLDDTDEYFTDMIQATEQRLDDWIEKLTKKKLLKGDYEQALAALEPKQQAIASELTALRVSLYDLQKQVGSAKEQLIPKRFREIEQEINLILQVYNNIEQTQNTKFAQEYTRDQAATNARKAFLESVFARWQHSYTDVNERLAALQHAGINAASGSFLKKCGWISAVVAGWFFSLWAGSTSSTNGNSSVRFFVVDSIARFTTRYTGIELLSGVIGFAVLITIISWLSHIALNKLGFGEDNKEGKASEEKNILQELGIDLTAQNEIIQTKFRANNWLALWLKMVPFIVFIFLAIAILAKYSMPEGTTGPDPFSALFDSLVNQTFGSFIAVCFAGVFILYLTKVIEPKSNDKDRQGGTRLSWEIIACIVLFFVLVIAMIGYHLSTPLFDDMRSIAMVGFCGSCVTTGILLGYGHRYTGLYSVGSFLLKKMNEVNLQLTQLVRPYTVNYLKYRLFHENILRLKTKMMEMIKDRTMQANVINTGTGSRKTVPVKEEHVDVNTSEDKRRFAWRRYIRRMFRWRHPNRSEGNVEANVMSDETALYFPELSASIAGITEQVNRLEKQAWEMDNAINDQWTNQGIYRSINDQITYVERSMLWLRKEMAALKSLQQQQRYRFYQEGERKKVLIQEGFYTGIWFSGQPEVPAHLLKP